MKLLNLIYFLGIFGIIILYLATGINLIWALGYLIILLLVGLVPKKFSVQTIIAFVLLIAIILLYKSTEIATVLSALLMLVSGLPGIIVYTIAYVINGGFLKNPLISNALAGISLMTLIFLIILHILKAFFDKLIKFTWFLFGIDIIPIVIDIIITLVMSYLVFTHVSTLYPTIQGWINNLSIFK